MSIICDCAEFTIRGCFEHSTHDPMRVMAFRCGHRDAKAGRPLATNELPFSEWSDMEQDHYRAGRAYATGRVAA